MKTTHRKPAVKRYRQSLRGGVKDYEHRLIMAEHLGRPLRSDECVHHINGYESINAAIAAEKE